MSTTQSQFPPDMAEVRWAIEVLEQRDARIHALLSVIGDSIDEDTIQHALATPAQGAGYATVRRPAEVADPGHEYAILRYGGSASNH